MEWTLKPNPEGSVSARQEEPGGASQAEGIGVGKAVGRMRLPVLAEAGGKETANGPQACTVWARHGRQMGSSSKIGAPSTADSDKRDAQWKQLSGFYEQIRSGSAALPLMEHAFKR